MPPPRRGRDRQVRADTRSGSRSTNESLASRSRRGKREPRRSTARQQPGLIGPPENARGAAERLEREAAELREVALRIDRGYAWWERDGFEIALDACALFSQWQPLSESVTRDFVYGNDEVDLCLPVPVQRAYGKALESGFFSRFEVCSTFDVEGDEVVAITYYLFGVQGFPRLGTRLFFVESWSS